MPLVKIKTFNNSFRNKATLFFTLFTTILIVVFCILFIKMQTKKFTEFLFANGKLYSEILSKNSKLGIFTGNQEMYENAVFSLMNQKNVVQCSIYDRDGKKLFRKTRVELKKDIKDEKFFLKKGAPHSGSSETNDHLYFWNTVISRRVSANIDPFDDTIFKEKIGYVCVVQEKQILKEQRIIIRDIGVSIGIVFWFIGFSLFYFAIKRFTTPLYKLKEGVKALDSGGIFEEIQIHQNDEVGALASAFNKLTRTLNKREAALKKSEEKLRNLSTKLIYSQEEERKRLSFELHDELGQSLAILKHNARYIKNNLDDPNHTVENCENMISYIDEIIENVRRLSMDLSPSIIEDLGLRETLKWMFQNFASQHKIGVAKKMSFSFNMDMYFSKEVQTNIYRLLQEVLTNIIKHSKADEVQFSVLESGDNLVLSVFDNGVGFDYNSTTFKFPGSRGIGLTAMEERARMIGGTLSVNSKKGKGTEIVLEVPIY
jgi:signal transduction histidine kinase